MNHFKLIAAMLGILTIAPLSVAHTQVAWVIDNDDFAGITLYADLNCSGTALAYYSNIGYPEQVSEIYQYASSVIVDGGWCINVPLEYQSDISTVTVDAGGNVEFALSSEDDPYAMASDYDTNGTSDDAFPATLTIATDTSTTGRACPATFIGIPSNKIYRLYGLPYQQHEYGTHGTGGGAGGQVTYHAGTLDATARANYHANGTFIVDVTYWMAVYARDGDGALRLMNCSTMKFSD